MGLSIFLKWFRLLQSSDQLHSRRMLAHQPSKRPRAPHCTDKLHFARCWRHVLRKSMVTCFNAFLWLLQQARWSSRSATS